MKKWLSRHKKLVIFLVVLAALLTAFLVIRHNVKQALAALENQVATATVERRDLTQSITATGVIESDSTKTIKTTLANVEVLSVAVEVGDVIAAGQTICTFDTEDIAQDLADARIDLSVANSQSALSVGNAERGVGDAETTRDYQLSTAQKELNDAFADFQEALSDYEEASRELSDLEEDEAEQENAFNKAERKYQAVEDDYADAANAYSRAQNEYGALKAEAANLQARAEAYAADDTGPEAEEARAEYREAQGELAELQMELNSAEREYLRLKSDYDERHADYVAAKSDYETAQAERETQEAKTDNLQNSLELAEQSYDQAARGYGYTQSSQDSSLAGSLSALSSSRLSAANAGQSYADLIDTYSKQLAKGVLASPISGTVTAVNVAEGDLYGGGAVVTVEDTGALIVVAEIDEYDVADVQLGMKAVFKTDATRDQELEGQVIYIAPRPVSGSGGEVTYQVKISVDTATDRLRLGMSAKVSIIVSETAGVLTVPYDAVQTDENGNDVVYVLEDGPANPALEAGPEQSAGQAANPAVVPQQPGLVNQRAIPVTVGVEGDYYVEVSGEGLEEGMTIVLPDSGYVDPFGAMMAF